jgi:hypothetical protein
MPYHSYSKLEETQIANPAQSDHSPGSKRTAPSDFLTNVSARQPYSRHGPSGSTSFGPSPNNVSAYQPYSGPGPSGSISISPGPVKVVACRPYSGPGTSESISSGHGPIVVAGYPTYNLWS